MPEVSGTEATRRIRSLDGTRARVPIVALTAQAFAEQVRECHAAGMDDHLAKPFTPDALLTAVARAAHVGSLRGSVITPPGIPGLEALVEADIPLSDTSAPSIGPNGFSAPAAVIGSELLVFDPAGFARTAAFLAPDAVTLYLQTIRVRCEDLRSGLTDGVDAPRRHHVPKWRC